MIPSASAGPNTVRNPKDTNGFTLTITVIREVW